MVDICGHVHHLGRYNSKASHIEYDRLIAEWLAVGRPGTEAQLNQDIRTTVIGPLLRAALNHLRKVVASEDVTTNSISVTKDGFCERGITGKHQS